MALVGLCSSGLDSSRPLRNRVHELYSDALRDPPMTSVVIPAGVLAYVAQQVARPVE